MNAPFPPAHDGEPQGNETTKAAAVDTDDRDQGMYEAGTPGAIERRLIHVDRVTEETLVQVRANNQTVIALIAMVAIVGVMVWLVHKELQKFEVNE